MLGLIFSLAMLLGACDPPPYVVTGPGTVMGWPQQPTLGSGGLEPLPCCGAK